MPLECPKCGKLHLLPLRDLSRAVDCVGCGESFALGPGGRICQSKKLLIRCPRCLEAVKIPERTVLTEFTCESCSLTFALPHAHGKLLPQNGSGRQRRSANTRSTTVAKHTSNPSQAMLPRCRWYGYMGVLSVVLLIIAALVWRSLSGGISEELADASKKLILATVSGDKDTIAGLIDPRHSASYRMWARETVRPAMQEASIGRGTIMRASLAGREQDMTWVKVNMDGPKGGSEFLLAWKRTEDGKWRLDALNTADSAQNHSQRRNSRRRLDVSF